ncbi:MAG: zinc-ribbon domain-containing protein [Collinsella sp.]
MICPHCLKTIEDGASFCPYCNAYVGPGDGPEHTEFVFCEGCGARLSPHDRTCPKCGRPAPVSSPRTRPHPTWQRAARRAFRA